MTKKHYEIIARAIAEEITWSHAHGLDIRAQGATNTARRIADALEQDNTRFNRARFLEACGVGKSAR